ncbi:MAG: YezD family protein [Clostridium sp.]|jgi:hypothetical protein|nr:YezD family protein [Clostridium sp.]MCH3963672.1 YezD family protein [Clostridium sp.]MCI1714813.1 YezD family protein [Clostridium sp.]MCI1798998.1 YezD family protein [Clostridium sp.]MCI1812996.1 YezD family protein [Clostridium sp.]MCI1869886.1 YezD family protein [Clostridium sp.]
MIFVGGVVAVNKKELHNNSISQENLDKLICMLSTIRYGSITLVVQDGKVVQIEKNEKVRLI